MSPQQNLYLATLAEVKAVMTSYMRLTHDLPLEVDEEKLARLLTSVRNTRLDEVTPEVGIELARIVGIAGKRVRMALPSGFPVVKTLKRNAYYANTSIGRPPVAVKFVDLDQMVTTEALERSVGVTAKALVDLEVGMLIPANVVAPEVTPDANASPPPAPAPEVKLGKAEIKRGKRLSEHKAHTCLCNQPVGHPCPAVRRYGATIHPSPMADTVAALPL